MENILLNAHEKLNNTDIGITWEQIKSNKSLHKNIYYDKFGYSWKVKNHVLMYSMDDYKNKRKHWEYAYMEAEDLPFKKFLTLEEFELIKPIWL